MIKSIFYFIVTVIIVPMLLSFLGWDDLKTTILCGILIALIEQIFILLKNSLAKDKKLDSFMKALQTKTNTDDTLLNLSNSILKLSLDGNADNDIFINFYTDTLKTLSEKVNKSFDTGKFELDYDMNKDDYAQLSKSIFQVFNKQTNDYFYTISKCDENSINWFFNINKMSNTYLKIAYSYLQNGKISQIKRLFVYETIDELNYDLINLLLQLHNNSGFNIRFISYNNFLAQFKKEHLYTDFGIYGQHFIFENNNYSSDENTFCGFNVDRSRILEYTECFNTVWDIAYRVEFDRQFTKAEIADNVIKLPVKEFPIQMQKLKFDEIDKIQSTVCDQYHIFCN